MFKRIISCFLTLSIVFIPLVVPVFADIGQDDPGDLIPEYDTPVSGSGAGPIAPLPVGTGVSMKASLRDLLANLRPILDKAGVFLGFDVLTDLAKEYMCPNLLGMITMHPFHEWYTPADFPEHKVCLKCGKTTTEIDVTWKDLWDDFVNRLPPGLSASDQGVTIYGTGLQIDYTYELGNQYWRNFDLYGTLNAADFGVLLTCSNDVYYSGIAIREHSSLPGVRCFYVTGSLELHPYTISDFPLGKIVKNLSNFESVSGVGFFLNYDDARSYYVATGNEARFLTPESYIWFESGQFDQGFLHHIENTGVISYAGSVLYDQSLSLGGYFNAFGKYETFPLIPGDTVVSDGYTEDSRPSGIMDAIQNYNTTHNYIDNSVVNYYIGSFDENDNLTGYYPMDIYDEQTLVFTEPVTAAQYQTTGWRYDYAARRYTLDLEPGTFALGDYDILQIKLTYGDEAVTIQYYNELGELVETDEYQYIMVAKEECTLNGHTYSAETTKEPTCTAAGERLLTCSVCGNQTVDEIPMTEHCSTFSVLKEPSCTAEGLGIYTCSTCGMQYTEPIPATEHTGVLLEVVDTVYGESGAVISVGYSVYECSTCGTQYVVHDDAGAGGAASGFWGSLVDSFANALAAAIDAVLGAIIYILETILGLITSLLGFFYSFITDTVLGGISDMIAVFTDGSLFEYFQDENGAVGLPSEVGTVFGFYSGMIMALPWEIRSVLFFGIAALILIAIFKLQ